MNLLRHGAGDRGEYVDRLGVLEREALEDAADDRAGLDRFGLPRVSAERAHARRHVPLIRERGVVRLDQRPQHGRFLRKRNELVE